MIKKAYIFIIICLSAILLHSQNTWSYNGKFAGMANSSVMLYDIWGVYNNQAGLANIDGIEIAANYENKFGLKETGTQSGVIGISTKTGVWGASFRRYGYSQYSENNVAITYSRNLGKYISAGLQFDYLFYNQNSDYKNYGAFLIETGIIAKPIDNFFIGFHVYNPTRVKLNNYNNQRVNTIVRLGVGYSFSEIVTATAEVEESINEKGRFKFGIEYNPVKHFYIRTGVATTPEQFFLGFGYQIKSLVIDIAAATHQSLPMSSQISVKYKI